MTPILAGLLPLLILIALALASLMLVGALSWWMLRRQARGDFDNPDEGEDE